MGKPKKVASEPTEAEAAIDSPKEMKEEKEENVSNTEGGKNGPQQPTVRKRGRPRKVVHAVQDQALNADAASGESESKPGMISKKLHADDALNSVGSNLRQQKESSSYNWKPRRREGSRRKGEPRRAAD